MNKLLLRQQLGQARKSFSKIEQEIAANKLATLFVERVEFINSQYIAAYWPIAGEISPITILKQAFRLKKRCFLPVIQSQEHDKLLSFIEYQLGDLLQLNHLGILQPYYKEDKRIPLEALDIVLTPLLAFDCQGNRLGMGGGYYDYTFAFLQKENAIQKPQLIGLAYDWQEVPALSAEGHDVLLSGIATDKRYISILIDIKR